MKIPSTAAPIIIFTLFTLAPTTAVLAQGGQANAGAISEAKQFMGKVNEAILFPLIMLMLAVGVLVFLYGAFEYVWNADNDGERSRGSKHMLWGIVGIMIMVSAWAILEIAANSFGLNDELNSARPDQIRSR